MHMPPTESASATRDIRVLIADDQAMIRGALTTLLELETDISVIGQACDGTDTISQLTDLQSAAELPNVVLMDVEMPRMDGITACEAIHHRFPSIHILMLTTFGRPGYVQRSLDAGAAGFIVKDAPSNQLADAVRRVAAGLRVIDPTLAVDTLSRGTSPLTEREADVLRAVTTGATITDIAAEMGISQGTVRNHISSAMLKTDARTRAEAARIATEAGWL